MVLAQKQIHRSLEQNRESRNEPTLTRAINLRKQRQDCTMRKRQHVQLTVLGKLDSYMQKNKTGLLSYTIYKINSKWIKELNVRLETIKLLEENIGSKLFDISHSNIFLDMSLQGRETKARIDK